MSCFFLVFDKTIPAGEMSAVLADIVPPYTDDGGWDKKGVTDFSMRVILDLLFFLIFQVVLFNVVTGLIVDNFTQVCGRGVCCQTSTDLQRLSYLLLVSPACVCV